MGETGAWIWQQRSREDLRACQDQDQQQQKNHCQEHRQHHHDHHYDHHYDHHHRQDDENRTHKELEGSLLQWLLHQVPPLRCLQCTRTVIEDYDDHDDEDNDYEDDYDYNHNHEDEEDYDDDDGGAGNHDDDEDHLSSHTPFNGIKCETRSDSFLLKN